MENKVWYYRNKINLSLESLSRLTGISVSELHKIESYKTNDIKLSNAVMLSKALKTNIYELFCIK